MHPSRQRPNGGKFEMMVDVSAWNNLRLQKSEVDAKGDEALGARQRLDFQSVVQRPERMTTCQSGCYGEWVQRRGEIKIGEVTYPRSDKSR